MAIQLHECMFTCDALRVCVGQWCASCPSGGEGRRGGRERGGGLEEGGREGGRKGRAGGEGREGGASA